MAGARGRIQLSYLEPGDEIISECSDWTLGQWRQEPGSKWGLEKQGGLEGPSELDRERRERGEMEGGKVTMDKRQKGEARGRMSSRQRRGKKKEQRKTMGGIQGGQQREKRSTAGGEEGKRKGKWDMGQSRGVAKEVHGDEIALGYKL